MSSESDALGELLKELRANTQSNWELSMQYRRIADQLETLMKLLPQPGDPRNKTFFHP